MATEEPQQRKGQMVPHSQTRTQPRRGMLEAGQRHCTSQPHLSNIPRHEERNLKDTENQKIQAQHSRILMLVTIDLRKKIPILRVLEVKDAVDIETSDGDYFLAHSRIPSGRSIQYRGQVSINRSRLGSNKYLKQERLEQCAKLMHVTPWLRKQELFG